MDFWWFNFGVIKERKMNTTKIKILFNYGKKADKDTEHLKSILYRPIPLYKRKEATKVQN